ncbi:glycosyltransferase [Flavobacterium reichenbachii]|uniref:glycosyltransferase n=1 Tax=Flavobacterium reichenbachii TaxID=362418 RepID=UPI000A9DEAEC|nr:glycosyltransferase [Flavobacterium reichenbachii]
MPKPINFTIITHVSHYKENAHLLGYAPYVREMNIWLKYIDSVTIVGPLSKEKAGNIDLAYEHSKISFKEITALALTTPLGVLKSMINLPFVLWQIFRAMQTADHIHLRCPGNVGLLGCLVQILFPSKIKTAKYAGNWDPESKQPWSYRLQKYILNNTFLTKNMQVLVYGEWPEQSKNIKSFFTATYSESDKEIIEKTSFNSGIKFIFVGSLVSGKNPLYAIKLVERLIEKGHNAVLDLYGEGVERKSLEEYIQNNKLNNHIFLKGNQNLEIVKSAYQNSHFVVLPSKSEGWPKAVAEGMFWGCVPISTSVSCVPFMLDYGKSGILLKMNLETDTAPIEAMLLDNQCFYSKSALSSGWSQNYTTDIFEAEIKKLLHK